MDQHEALLKAQNDVKMPKYDARHDEWVVNYTKEGKKHSKVFPTEDGAWAFFYKKLREIREFYQRQMSIPFGRNK